MCVCVCERERERQRERETERERERDLPRITQQVDGQAGTLSVCLDSALSSAGGRTDGPACQPPPLLPRPQGELLRKRLLFHQLLLVSSPGSSPHLPSICLDLHLSLFQV